MLSVGSAVISRVRWLYCCDEGVFGCIALITRVCWLWYNEESSLAILQGCGKCVGYTAVMGRVCECVSVLVTLQTRKGCCSFGLVSLLL